MQRGRSDTQTRAMHTISDAPRTRSPLQSHGGAPMSASMGVTPRIVCDTRATSRASSCAIGCGSLVGHAAGNFSRQPMRSTTSAPVHGRPQDSPLLAEKQSTTRMLFPFTREQRESRTTNTRWGAFFHAESPGGERHRLCITVGCLVATSTSRPILHAPMEAPVTPAPCTDGRCKLAGGQRLMREAVFHPAANSSRAPSRTCGALRTVQSSPR